MFVHGLRAPQGQGPHFAYLPTPVVPRSEPGPARPLKQEHLLRGTQAPTPLAGTFFKGFHLRKGACGLTEV